MRRSPYEGLHVLKNPSRSQIRFTISPDRSEVARTDAMEHFFVGVMRWGVSCVRACNR